MAKKNIQGKKSRPGIPKADPKPTRKTGVNEAIWNEYDRFIEDAARASLDAEQSKGQWQDLLGEIINDLQMRARG